MNETTDNRDVVLSKTITIVRFPLIVAIVLIHTYISDQPNVGGVIMVPSGSLPIFDTWEYILRQCIAELAVPTFFLISGFLFFYKTDTFTIDTYKYKLRKRFRSLLLPYLIWNLIYMGYVLTVQSVVPSLTSPDRKMIVDYSLVDFVDSFWHFDGVSYGGPIYGPLWFIRDLMVIDVLSPVLYLFIKRTKYVVLIILGALYIAGIGLLTPGLGMQSLLFFSIGAYLSINKINILNMNNKYIIVCLFAGIGFLIVDVFTRGYYLNPFLHRSFIVLLTLVILPMVAKLNINKDKKIYYLLAESSFFVYVTHRFIITFPNKFWVILLPVNTLTASLSLLLIPIVVSFICFLTYLFFKSIFPKFTAFLIGGR